MLVLKWIEKSPRKIRPCYRSVEFCSSISMNQFPRRSSHIVLCVWWELYIVLLSISSEPISQQILSYCFEPISQEILFNALRTCKEYSHLNILNQFPRRYWHIALRFWWGVLNQFPSRSRHTVLSNPFAHRFQWEFYLEFISSNILNQFPRRSCHTILCVWWELYIVFLSRYSE